MTEHEHRMQCAIAYIGELQRRAKAHRYSTAGAYELALEALREKAEREKGCVLCVDAINLEEPLDVKTHLGYTVTTPFNFCPACGRPLKGGE